jgi:transposase
MAKKFTLGPNKDIIDRRTQVARLRFVRRWPIEQIAKALNVSDATVERDLKAIMEYGAHVGTDIMKESTEKIVWEITSNFHERQMERWQQYTTQTNAGLKRRLLNDVRDDEEQYYKLMQSLGAVYQKPEELEHAHENFEDKMKRLRAEREAAERGITPAKDPDAEEEEEVEPITPTENPSIDELRE